MQPPQFLISSSSSSSKTIKSISSNVNNNCSRHRYFYFCCLVFYATFQLINAASVRQIEDAAYWRQHGKSHLENVLEKLKKSKISIDDGMKAKNIIIFIGDGMGMTSITAGRIYKGQLKGQQGEEESLVFEDFPNTAMSKTYNVDKQVPDSAGTATAMFSGVKTRYSVIGMDATLSKTDAKRGQLTTIMDWATQSGKRTGIVTTTRITHATPASTYANVFHRDWECNSVIPEESAQIYKDIARQLVEDAPGKDFNVILGGGLSPMGDRNPNEKSTVQFHGATETICTRTDGRNLTDEWLKLQPTAAQSNDIIAKDNNNNTGNPGNVAMNRKFVKTRDDLMNVNPDETEYLLGLFRNNHITYSIARQQDEPSLSEMTQQAIRILDRTDSKGFVLMVEGGRIDQAHHQNYGRAALQEIIEMDAAIEVALNMTKSSETLIIVTADHSHSLTFNGYPDRGNDILGLANKTGFTQPYETLTYANGPGFWDHLYNGTNANNIDEATDGIWINVASLGEKRSEPTYRHLATFGAKDESHGGEDVGVYATGPGSELIRGTFEQNYLAYVMSYAGCMGPVKDMNELCSENSETTTLSGSDSIRNDESVILLSLIIYSVCKFIYY